MYISQNDSKQNISTAYRITSLPPWLRGYFDLSAINSRKGSGTENRLLFLIA